MKELFQSERLIYRSVDKEKDEEFFRAIGGDSIIHQLSSSGIALPQTSDGVKDEMKFAMETCFLGVIICIKWSSSSQDSTRVVDVADTTPIGLLHMMGANTTRIAHHRRIDFGIKMLQEHQGKGYGSEAILWGLNWAFNVAGMHRVQIGCFEYNTRAIHLYQKLGFKLEGRGRESFWHNGRFWDDIQFGMLDREWRDTVLKGESAQSKHHNS